MVKSGRVSVPGQHHCSASYLDQYSFGLLYELRRNSLLVLAGCFQELDLDQLVLRKLLLQFIGDRSRDAILADMDGRPD